MSINIFGEIGFDVTANDVFDLIKSESGEEIDVVIASGGGSAFEGLMIYDALKATGKKINTKIMGLGASAASVIFMAGDKREMGDGSLLMVHNSWSMFVGNAEEVRQQLGTLDAIDDRMTNIFMKATGLEESKVKDLLNDETFMPVDEAIDLGFATGKVEASKVAASLYESYKTQKEPVDMAKENIKSVEVTEDEKGMFAKFLAWLPVAKADDAKAEDVVEEEVIDDAKAEEDDKDAEIEALKAEVEALKAASAEKAEQEEASAKAKAEQEEEKNSLLDSAMMDNKILLSDAAEMRKASLEDVKARLESLSENATKRGSEGEPARGSDVSAFERYKAIQDPAERKAYLKENKDAVISSDPANK